MRKIFYGGHLRPFKHVGHHPQFEHIRYPPPGYQFVNGRTLSVAAGRRFLKSLGELSWTATKNGSTLPALAKFIRSHSVRAQLGVPLDVSLAFLPSMPFFLGQIPWLIEIEDTTTLFVPFAKIAGRRQDPRLFGTGGIYHSGFSSRRQGSVAIQKLSRNYHPRQVYSREHPGSIQRCRTRSEGFPHSIRHSAASCGQDAQG
jgi:hypothetical protein